MAPDVKNPTVKSRSAIGQTQWFRSLAQYSVLLLVLLAMIGVFGVSAENFLQRSTLTTIANQVPALTLVAVGMTFVLLVGRIDLSVGSMLAFASATLGVLMVDYEWPLWGAVSVGLAAGGACGLLNGLVTVSFRIPSFIATLGMLEVARGATKVVTDSQII